MTSTAVNCLFTNANTVGLLKIDFLGLRNLTILDNAIHFVKRDFDRNFDIHQISLEDSKTLQVFQKADTAGIFQFESSGIRNVLELQLFLHLWIFFDAFSYSQH